ncbi:hypothetical protein ACSNOI_18140 [Actinomadura kijaniata]
MDRYCAVLVGKATDGTSAANARAKMLRAASKDDPKATAFAATLLMTWYPNTGSAPTATGATA